MVLVVLHRPGDQVSYLREVLACKSRMPVVEAIQSQELLVATCYLGQPSEHLEVDELVHAKLLADPRMSGAAAQSTISSVRLRAMPGQKGEMAVILQVSREAERPTARRYV